MAAIGAVAASQVWPPHARSQVPVGAKRGSFERLEAFASAHVAPRRIDIWLPPDYVSGNTRYRVLYMHDGQNLFDPANSAWNKVWAVDQHIETLLENRAIEDVIVVGIWNTPRRTCEYAPADLISRLPTTLQEKFIAYAGGPLLSDAYARFIAEELKPTIDRTYRTRRGAENAALMGSSMGGLISLYTLMRYPRVFGSAACVSTHWPLTVAARGGWEDGDWRADIIAAQRAFLLESALDPKRHRLYFDYGTETLDALYEPYQQHADQALAAKGFAFGRGWETHRFPGAAHEENAWNARLETPLLFLFGRGG